jgi:type VI secretion system protein
LHCVKNHPSDVSYHRSMTITLKVISYRGRAPDENLEASFSEEGGTLGRSPENRSSHLTLSDPEKYISRKHAAVAYKNGGYHLTDTSKDGTTIINRNIRLCRDTAVLNNGDRLKIGDYEVQVRIPDSDISSAIESLPKNNDVFLEENSLFRQTVVSQPGRDLSSKTSETYPLPRATESSPLHDPFVLPDLSDSQGVPEKIPENFDFSELIADENTGENPPPVQYPVRDPILIKHPIAGSDAAEAPPGDSRPDFSSRPLNSQAPAEQALEQPVEEPVPAESGAPRTRRIQARLDLCEAFMAGAGLKNSTIPRNESADVFMNKMGAMVREMIGGLMVILKGHAELKSTLRLSATAITPAGNNPLKCFEIVDEIVDQLLTNGKPGFLNAQDAVQDAFTDIKNHQMAMTAGVQEAIIKMIERFDPQHFAAQNHGGVVFHRKAKSWDAYEQFYARIATDTLEDFFGEAFARGYEKQMRKLRKKTDKGPKGT